MSRLLVIEDNERISRFVERGLRSAGFDVSVVASGTEGLEAARATRPDLIVLDLGLPDIDGLEVLGTLRSEGHDTPVVILTARGDVPDKVVGFNAGADDYLTKPFAFAELLIRVRARLRQPSRAEATELVVGDLRLDLHAHRVFTPDLGERGLPQREFALLEVLMREPNVVHSRESLLERVWGITFDPQSNVVDVYVRYLRRKVGAERITTVRGGGYTLAGDPDLSS